MNISKTALIFFGRGINEVADKWDAIAPYKYHIALENSNFQDEITEKLYDTFLCESYPFYYGAPNANDFFPSGSMTTIDIENPDSAIKVIEDTMRELDLSLVSSKLQESKKLVLDQFNLFEIIRSCVAKLPVVDKPRKYQFLPETNFINKQGSHPHHLRKMLSKMKSILTTNNSK